MHARGDAGRRQPAQYPGRAGPGDRRRAVPAPLITSGRRNWRPSNIDNGNYWNRSASGLRLSWYPGISGWSRRSLMRTRGYRVAALLCAVAAALVVRPAAGAAAGPADTPVDAPRPVLAGIDLEAATVLDLQAAMRDGRLTSAQLTGFYLRRIRALNPRLHAVIETNPGATADAAASDARRAAQGGRGPLEGIPVLLKDNIDTADRQHTTAGSFALG